MQDRYCPLKSRYSDTPVLVIDTEADPHESAQQRSPATAFEVPPDVEQGEGEQAVEQSVGGGGAADRKRAERRAGHGQRDQRGIFAEAPAGGPELTFPPDGAQVEVPEGGLTVKLRGGVPPFTWLANGAPVIVGARARESLLPLPAAGFVTLTVLDAEGRSASAQVRLTP